MAFGGLAPSQVLRSAVAALGREETITAISSLYETQPIGFREQASFVNAVAALDTHLSPTELLNLLFAIERKFGRERDLPLLPNGPRTLDLDLLLYDDVVLEQEQLTIPHPRLAERRFVLAPLAELAPTLLHPVLGRTMQQLLDSLPTTGENGVDAVWPLPASRDFVNHSG